MSTRPPEERTAREGPGSVPSEVLAAEGERQLLEPVVPTKIGRFSVIGPIGRGGMGLVVLGYDEKLDRKVAIKLVLRPLSIGSEGRERMLREAQAMAQLSHPNVVQIYEVGEIDDSMWVAMEFVDGSTLREWAKGKAWREVLDALLQAGRGLAAAHERGIVHRDLKPDNVLVGDDGRARVLDFGLATAGEAAETQPAGEIEDAPADNGLTQDGVIVGTPRYMSPEQHRGDTLDARSDQFGFCVMAFELLHGVRPFEGEYRLELARATHQGEIRDPPRSSPVPSWVHKAIVRGLEARPERRWESMEALLAVLGRDPAKRRRSVMLAGGALVAVVGALVLGRAGAPKAAEANTCADAASELDEAWNDAHRTKVRAAFSELEVPYALESFDRAAKELDAYAEGWVKMREQVCRDRAAGRDLPRRTALRLRCLDHAAAELAAFVELLESPDDKTAERAVQAAQHLQSVDECADPRLLDAESEELDEKTAAASEELRLELARTYPLSRAGRVDAARDATQKIDEQVAKLGHRPLRAESRHALGRALMDAGESEEALAVFEAGFADAVATGQDSLAIDLAIELLYVEGDRAGRHDAGLRWANIAEALLERAGDDTRRRAKLDMHVGNVLRHKGEFEPALERLKAAVEGFEAAVGPNHLDVGTARNNLGGAQWRLRDLSGARESLEAGLRIRRDVLGPRHPAVASSLNNLGLVLASAGQHVEALAMHTDALAIKRELLGEKHPSIAYSLHNRGDTLLALGRADEAEAQLREALAMRRELLGEKHPAVVDTLGSLGRALMAQERDDEGRALLKEALAMGEEVLGAEHPDLTEIRAALSADD